MCNFKVEGLNCTNETLTLYLIFINSITLYLVLYYSPTVYIMLGVVWGWITII